MCVSGLRAQKLMIIAKFAKDAWMGPAGGSTGRIQAPQWRGNAAALERLGLRKRAGLKRRQEGQARQVRAVKRVEDFNKEARKA